MTSNFEIKFSGSTNPFDEWFLEERGTSIEYEIESDVDEVEEDSFDDPESY